MEVMHVFPPLATRWRVLVGGLALLLAIAWTLSSPKIAVAEEHAGFVLDIVGTWYLEGAQPRKIAGGDKLPSGGSIAPKPVDPTSRLVMCLFNGKTKTYTAKDTLPKRAEPSIKDKLVRAISGHYHGGIVHAVSRGEDLADAVLRLSDGKLDVAPLVSGLRADTYLLRFAPAQESLPKDAAATLTVDWKPQAKLVIGAATLVSGLYRVQLLSKRTRQPTGSEALVLVSSADDYDARQKTFEEAKALTQTWDEEVRKIVATDVLRACLESLADPQAE
jgi:hypothetical protein